MNSKRGVFKPSGFASLSSWAARLLGIAAIAAVFCFALAQAEESSANAALRSLEDGIMRAAVKCYALEGSYPDDLSYIEENYGIHIDRNRYVVHYDVFSSNIQPDITVIRL